jgi:hypothetical protein
MDFEMERILIHFKNCTVTVYFFFNGNMKISVIKDHEHQLLQSKTKCFYSTNHKTLQNQRHVL